jgi:hypothetical protein
VSYLDVRGWNVSTIAELCVLGWRQSNAVLEKSVEKRGGVSSAVTCAFFLLETDGEEVREESRTKRGALKTEVH